MTQSVHDFSPDYEPTLVRRLASRDMDAAAELYDLYAARVYGLARRIVRNDSDAEDIVQDVFSQAWRTAGAYDGRRGSVVGWLLMITRTRAIDRLRARQRRPDTDDAVRPDALAAAEIPDLVIAAEEADLVRRALLELPPPQRAALELAYYEGLTQAEIATRLAEPLGTVKTRMRTALNTLRARLRA